MSTDFQDTRDRAAARGEGLHHREARRADPLHDRPRRQAEQEDHRARHAPRQRRRSVLMMISEICFNFL